MKTTIGWTLFVLSVLVLFVGTASETAAQNKVVVIPLISDGPVCTGTLVGTRWCDNGDSTVTDMTTGLVWLEYAGWGGLEGRRPWRSNTSGDYDDARTRAGLLQDGDVVHSPPPPAIGVRLSDGSVVGDWRLPTKSELNHLTRGPERVVTATPRAFKNVIPDYFWSISTTEALSQAWTIHMAEGGERKDPKDDEWRVWPVRGSK